MKPNRITNADSGTVSKGIAKTHVGSRSSVKTYVLTLSKQFMTTHPKAGQPTDFFEKIRAGIKKHTIRGNYDLWKKRIDEIHAGIAVLSIREWSGKPYASPQIELMKTTQVSVQKLERTLLGWFVDDVDSDLCFYTLSANDGLSFEDFKSWFKSVKLNKPMAIIHFTNLRY